jgi:formate dehydrogenase subunit gamma
MKPAGQPADPIVLSICRARGNEPAALIEILHDISAQKGAVPETDLIWIAEALNLSRAEVFGTMSFYPDFHATPPAGTVVKVCRGEACQAMGAKALEAALVAGSDHTPPARIEPVYCLGNCALAPAAMIGETLIGRASPDRVRRALAEAGK